MEWERAVEAVEEEGALRTTWAGEGGGSWEARRDRKPKRVEEEERESGRWKGISGSG
jgi:hypothetical protein